MTNWMEEMNQKETELINSLEGAHIVQVKQEANNFGVLTVRFTLSDGRVVEFYGTCYSTVGVFEVRESDV